MLLKILAFIVLVFSAICAAVFAHIYKLQDNEMNEMHTILFGCCVVALTVFSMLLALVTII